MSNKVARLKPRKPAAALDSPTDLDHDAVKSVSAALNGLLATSYALFLKTKNFHWHVSGPHFRDYHLLLDDQAADILGATDDMAERVRKLGGTTLRSIGQIGKLQTIEDNEEEFVPPAEMLRELMNDNKRVASDLRDQAENGPGSYSRLTAPRVTAVTNRGPGICCEGALFLWAPSAFAARPVGTVCYP